MKKAEMKAEMTENEAYKACDEVWAALPADYEDAFNVLQLVVCRLVDADRTGHNRKLFIQWLQHTAADVPAAVPAAVH